MFTHQQTPVTLLKSSLLFAIATLIAVAFLAPKPAEAGIGRISKLVKKTKVSKINKTPDMSLNGNQAVVVEKPIFRPEEPAILESIFTKPRVDHGDSAKEAAKMFGSAVPPVKRGNLVRSKLGEFKSEVCFCIQ
jgi:hypothetical protein